MTTTGGVTRSAKAALIRGLAAAMAAMALVAGVTGAQQTAAGDARLLPGDGFAAGWKKAGTPRVFTRADLYGHINGGAEVFLELGFEQLTVQRYEGGAGTLGVELYRMADAAAARGIYLARRGRETRDAGLKARHTVNPYQLLLQQDRFFLAINDLSGGAVSAPVMVKAAASIVGTLPADVSVKELEILPRADLVDGSERIARGPFGLQAIYTLGEGDMLQLGGRLTAVSGVYRSQAGGSQTLVLVDYPSASAAERAFGHVRTNLDPLIKVLRTQGTRLVFQDYGKKYGVASVDGRRLEIRVGLERPPG